MDGAEGGVDLGGREPAATAVGEAMGAASGVVDEAGFSGLLGSISSFWIWIAGVHSPGNADGFENKGVAGKAIRKSMKTKGEQNARAPFGTLGKKTPGPLRERTVPGKCGTRSGV